MSDDTIPVTPLSRRESWELLASCPVGRLATSVSQQPDIFPVNHVVDGESLIFRTAQGSKLLELTINSHVAFEADSWDAEHGGWSVVCRGRAEVLESHADREHAESLPLQPWTATVKSVFVRINVEEIVGRSFTFGGEAAEPFEPED